MSFLSILRTAAGAALLINAVPHAAQGLQGKQFPTPFGNPPGVGMSPPTVNLGWSGANAVAGIVLLGRGVRGTGESVSAVVGAAAMAAIISYHFGDVLRGGTGLRGLRTRPEGETAGPPRALVKVTEPVARALAGRRWFPLWAIVHHRGRKSGALYQTPVAVVPTVDPNLILIALAWGANTNWGRNVVAADGATLTWKGIEQTASAPRIVDPAEAAVLARRPYNLLLERMPAALVLHKAEIASSTEPRSDTSGVAVDQR